MAGAASITGRCYCGAVRFEAWTEPTTVCVCHCEDCRRATGGPATAVAAFQDDDVAFTSNVARYTPPAGGVERTFCSTCGTSLAFRGDYVPGQIYVHIGILDDAEQFRPDVESFTRERLPWLHVDGIDGRLLRFSGTARDGLNAAAGVELDG